MLLRYQIVTVVVNKLCVFRDVVVDGVDQNACVHASGSKPNEEEDVKMRNISRESKKEENRERKRKSVKKKFFFIHFSSEKKRRI